jgi:D-3-phosphoglycerate dehydrogenase
LKPTRWKVAISEDVAFSDDIARLLKAEIDVEIKLAPCSTQEAFAVAAQDCHAVAVGDYPISAPVIDQLGRCLLLARTGAGLDAVDLGAARRNGIRVTNVPDYGMEDVASHALMLMLALARHLKTWERILRSGSWDRLGTGPIFRVHGHTIGILGLGRIGKTFARQVSGLGCRVVANDPYLEHQVFRVHGAEEVDFDTLIESSDFLSLHVPLTDETRHIIGAQELARMKSTAYLINTSRGAVVDQKALVHALRSGRIAGAGLDVFEDEPISPNDGLLTLENVILTPHVAWCSEESRHTMAERTVEEIIRAFQGKPARSPVVDVPLRTV